MSDLALRELERRWQRSQAAEDLVRLLEARRRAGLIPCERLELAAFLGDDAARTALGEPVPADPPWNAWARALDPGAARPLLLLARWELLGAGVAPVRPPPVQVSPELRAAHETFLRELLGVVAGRLELVLWDEAAVEAAFAAVLDPPAVTAGAVLGLVERLEATQAAGGLIPRPALDAVRAAERLLQGSPREFFHLREAATCEHPPVRAALLAWARGEVTA